MGTPISTPAMSNTATWQQDHTPFHMPVYPGDATRQCGKDHYCLLCPRVSCKSVSRPVLKAVCPIKPHQCWRTCLYTYHVPGSSYGGGDMLVHAPVVSQRQRWQHRQTWFCSCCVPTPPSGVMAKPVLASAVSKPCHGECTPICIYHVSAMPRTMQLCLLVHVESQHHH